MPLGSEGGVQASWTLLGWSRRWLTVGGARPRGGACLVLTVTHGLPVWPAGL